MMNFMAGTSVPDLTAYDVICSRQPSRFVKPAELFSFSKTIQCAQISIHPHSSTFGQDTYLHRGIEGHIGDPQSQAAMTVALAEHLME